MEAGRSDPNPIAQKQWEEFRFVGKEPTIEEFIPAMSAARKRAEMAGIQNIVFRRGDVGALPFADECFDAVTSNYVYHNIPSRERQVHVDL